MTTFMVIPPSILSDEYMDQEQAKRFARAIGLYNVTPIVTPSGGLASGREWLNILCTGITPALTNNGKLHIVLIASAEEVIATEDGESPETACVRILLDNGVHLKDYADEVTLVYVIDSGKMLHFQYIRRLNGDSELWREFHGQL